MEPLQCEQLGLEYLKILCYFITGNGIVQNIPKGLPVVAAAVITQDNDDR